MQPRPSHVETESKRGGLGSAATALMPLPHMYLAGGAVFLLAIVLFRDFVFGDRTLLYTDIGSDSVNIFYPYYVLRSDYLRNVGLFSWSFSVGLGQNLYPYLGTILISPVVFLPKAAIAYALIYQHLFYTAVASLCFAGFLRLRGLPSSSCVLGAMCLGLSGYMCIGSCWYFHAAETACFAVLLLATEYAIVRRGWAWLSLAVVLVSFLGAFHLYLGAVLLILYVPLRVVSLSAANRESARVIVSLAFAAALGAGMSAFVAIPSLLGQLNSPRGAGLTSRVAELSRHPVFGLESGLYYLTALFRLFGNDMLGTGSDFHGWQNYLEAPINYCGLACLLILPQTLLDRRTRVFVAVCLGAIAISIAFPWLRYLFWAFQGDYFRTLSLFSDFALITLAATAFAQYTRGAAHNLWLLGVTLAALLALLFWPGTLLQTIINRQERLYAMVFLVVYAALFVVGQIVSRQRIFTWLIVAVAGVELILLGQFTVGSRPTLTKSQLNQRVGYNDETVEAIRDLKASDQSFYRVTKTWSSSPGAYASLNDAMVFGYYSTTSYSSFNNINYVAFLQSVDAIPAQDLRSKTQWSLGLLRYPLLSTFACEKYVLTDDPEFYASAGPYIFVRRYGKASLFRNELFLPLGLTYNRAIRSDVFAGLPQAAKAEALLHAVVLPAGESGPLPFLTTDELADEVARVPLPEADRELRNNALGISAFSQTRITGTLRDGEDRVVVLQTPFDAGWRAYQDGTPAKVMRVDGGLLGAVIRRGEHRVEFRYRPPFLATGMFVSAVSIALLLVGLRFAPRL